MLRECDASLGLKILFERVQLGVLVIHTFSRPVYIGKGRRLMKWQGQSAKSVLSSLFYLFVFVVLNVRWSAERPLVTLLSDVSYVFTLPYDMLQLLWIMTVTVWRCWSPGPQTWNLQVQVTPLLASYCRFFLLYRTSQYGILVNGATLRNMQSIRRQVQKKCRILSFFISLFACLFGIKQCIGPLTRLVFSEQ